PARPGSMPAHRVVGRSPARQSRPASPHLSVGPASYAFEQEADHLADRVTPASGRIGRFPAFNPATQQPVQRTSTPKAAHGCQFWLQAKLVIGPVNDPL